MAANLEITESELLEALAQAAGSEPKGAKTLQELCESTGIYERRILLALKAYQRQGRLQSHRVPRPAIDGSMRRVPAYTILPAKKR